MSKSLIMPNMQHLNEKSESNRHGRTGIAYIGIKHEIHQQVSREELLTTL